MIWNISEANKDSLFKMCSEGAFLVKTDFPSSNGVITYKLGKFDRLSLNVVSYSFIVIAKNILFTLGSMLVVINRLTAQIIVKVNDDWCQIPIQF